MIENKMANTKSQEEIATGLNSTDIKENEDIPFVDESAEFEVPEPIRPKRNREIEKPIVNSFADLLKDDVTPKKIHAKDIGPVHTSPDNDTIVVSTPEGTLYITLTDTPKKNTSSPESTTSNVPSPNASSALRSPSRESTSTSVDDEQPSTSKAQGAEESSSLIDKEVEIAQRKVSLRRNSISMPTLQNLEMEVIKQHYLDDPDEIPEHHVSTTSFGEERAREAFSDDEQPNRTPLRNARRKSGAPVRRLGRSEFSMDEDEYSPSNSVTSINSLASLLREKIQSIPQKIRKKPTDYKLRAFVGLMFLAVAFFIGFAYVLYHRQALTKAYFENVQFNEPKRLLRVVNKDDMEILKASLAITIPGKSKSYPCLLEHRKSDGSICLEWLQTLRFYLKSLPFDNTLGNITCYSIHWKALNHDISPNDCFDYSDTKVHWYGAGQSVNVTWPLNTGSLDYTPFVTGDMQRPQWSNVLSRYLINSKGAAILIDEDSPVHISINKDKKQICLKAKHDDFAFANRFTDFTEMKYNICSAHDMRSLHSALHSHQNNPLWDGLKPEEMDTLKSLMSEPIWEIAPRFKEELTADTLAKYTEDVILLGFLKQGHVLINEFWQKEIGDFTIDTTRFETLNTTLDKLRRRGFKVTLTVQPFISTESENFADCVQKRLLISERNSDRRIPALTRFKSLESAGMLDITNNNTIPWIKERLDTVIEKYRIDSFYLDLGTAYDMPYYYRCEKSLVNPDQYKTLFTKTFKELYRVIGVSSSVSLPKPPTFVSLPPFESSWEALRRVIPTMLTYGISGYPFLMPGAVGGDIHWPGSEQFLPAAKESHDKNSTEDVHDNRTSLPESELYIRWLQMATFLPVIKFTHLPKEKRVLDIAKNLTALRQKMITPLFLKYQRDALDDGLPLVRPLWLVTGGDAALSLQDEFAIGDELIVAPILNKGQTTRDVYLPAGLWQDGIDGSHHKGNRWVHDYKVPLDKVAYFIRKPDDMRFR